MTTLFMQIKKPFVAFTCSLFCMASVISTEQPRSFDWGAMMTLPPAVGKVGGNQVLHVFPRDKSYLESSEATAFVNEHLTHAVPIQSDAEVLKFGSDHVRIKGCFVELGVGTGRTVNFLAALNPHRKIYGFDSFEGLPEDWNRGDVMNAKGTFAFKDPSMSPPVLHNVDLRKGWFDETLPAFALTLPEGESIAFLHVDCDLYSSTSCALEALGDRIKPGTIIVFDELYNYPNYRNHEFKAFEEFLKEKGYTAEYLAYNVNHEQVAVRIVQCSKGH